MGFGDKQAGGAGGRARAELSGLDEGDLAQPRPVASQSGGHAQHPAPYDQYVWVGLGLASGADS